MHVYLFAYACTLQVKPLIWVESVIERHAHSRVEYMIKVNVLRTFVAVYHSASCTSGLVNLHLAKNERILLQHNLVELPIRSSTFCIS